MIEIAVRENRILFPPGKAGEIGVDTFGRQSVVWFDEKDKEKLGNAFMVDVGWFLLRLVLGGG